MAFQAGGTNYQGFLDQRRMADEGVTRSLKAKGERERQARVKKSGERSGLAKLGSAAVRGAAAYYTGGLSEQYGGGEMIDQAMLGTDSEGRAVRNEYGGLVKAGSAVYQGSKAQKAGKLGEQDARFDKLLARRSKNVSDLYAAGDVAGGKEAQQALESMEAKYHTNRKDAEGKGWGGSGLGMSDEDYQLMPEAMTQEQMDAKRKILDGVTSGGGRGTSTGRGAQLGMPDRPDAPQGLIPPSQRAPILSGPQRGAKVESAAQKFETSGGSPTLQAQAASEKEDLIKRLGDRPSQQIQRQIKTPSPSNKRDEGVDDWGQEQGFIKNPEWNQYTNSQRATDEGSSIVPRRKKFMQSSMMPSANW